jgi:hypothetical protein
MNTTRETVPAVWSEADERFFRVVAEVFPTDFVWGAGALLASYDLEIAPAATAAQHVSSATAAVAGASAARA